MMRYSLLSFLLVCGAQAQAGNLVMPQDLVTYAHANGCSEIVDFYDREGRVDPPYAYGYIPGDAEDSAVLWCVKDKSDSKQFVLLFMLKDSHDLTCPKSIIQNDYPGGLTVRNGLKLNLEKFWYINNPENHGPKGVVTDGNVVESYYDGISDYFYCYKGSWLKFATD